jgi:predicted DCC family thiol-disulfide oxidoreductase YuxK
MNKASHPEDFVLLFDGVCNLCNGAVRFVFQHDRTRRIKFCPLQSEAGEALLSRHNIASNGLDTLIYLRGGQVFTKSRAVLKVLSDMGGIWSLAGVVFRIIPKTVADFLYDRVARSRYKVFGKRAECMVPDEAVRARFL